MSQPKSAKRAQPAECKALRASAPFVGKQGFTYAPAVSAEKNFAASLERLEDGFRRGRDIVATRLRGA